MKNSLFDLPFAAAVLTAATAAFAASPSAEPPPPPPRGVSPAAPLPAPGPVAPSTPASGASRLQGPPAEELVRQITAGRSFPITVDAMSRLDSVEGRGDTLTYNYTAIALPDSREERLQLSQSVREGIDARACATPDFAKLLEAGYTVLLNYSFGAPDEDVHVRVAPRRCPR